MLKYLIIQLDDFSTSFCHYTNERTQGNLMRLETLKDGIFWSMKENLTIQFIYPDYEIPKDYKDEIIKTFHADIVSSACIDISLRNNADIVIFDTFASVDSYPLNQNQSYVFRTTLNELLENSSILGAMFGKVNRINIVITDIPSFKNEDEDKYSYFLNSLIEKIVEEYKNGHAIQINLLTDRMFLDKMNNCNAGDESITLAPDGKFYICPAFYLDGGKAVGDLENGLDIKNQQLYRFDHAPICRRCDAYQCRRCVWLNRKTTLEVNTPSHEQCVVAHIERNASRRLLAAIRELGEFLPETVIKEIDYLDPFDLIIH